MNIQTSEDIRKAFLQYFEKLNHKIIPSSPLVPLNDKTILFTNAGMNQFKDILLGIEKISSKRVVSCQMCLRAGGKHNDLDVVGHDDRHNTFFEMLGNWSFGDYWKKEAITWAWDFTTNVLQIPKNKLYVSVYKTDDELYNIWEKEIGLNKERIFRLGDIESGDEENFWSMGPVGPCGPCSEIYYDFGEQHGCRKPSCAPGCNCDRYIEFWNLVFTELNKEKNGKLTPLKFKSVDTGMGLERVALIKQNVSSVFETDLFTPITSKFSSISGNKDSKKINIIADHLRALTFALAEKLDFSNEGRGYVLRRILRRAETNIMNINKPILFSLVDTVITKMEHIYPHLKKQKNEIIKKIKQEEENFHETIKKANKYLEEIISNTKESKVINGTDLFKLYDTFGLPIEITEIIAKNKGFTLDIEGFKKAIHKQREQSRKSANFYENEITPEWTELNGGKSTEFVGYTTSEVNTNIQRYRQVNNKIEIVVDKIPLYVESGGQVSDIGSITIKDKIYKIHTVSKKDNQIVLICESFDTSKLKPSETVKIQVDKLHRFNVSCHHTATHLLHYALKKIVNKDIHQAGSNVEADKFSFDFKYKTGLDENQILEIETLVNDIIQKNLSVNIYSMSYKEAVKSNVVALFNDKYSEQVRVIDIGQGLSKELCGGTHVKATGNIGLFSIQSEKAIAAGTRRIIATVGSHALKNLQSMKHKFNALKKIFSSTDAEIVEIAKKTVKENITAKKQFSTLNRTKVLDEILINAEKNILNIHNVSYIIETTSDLNKNDLLDIMLKIKAKHPKAITILLNTIQEKTLINLYVPKIQEKFTAKELINLIVKEFGGKGGGKDEIAFGGINKKITKKELVKILSSH